MKNKVLTVSTIILGLLAAIGPRTIFPVCSAGEMKMRCYYTAQWELVVGLLAVFAGLSLFFITDEKIKTVVSAVQVILGALIILIPTAIIGVCGSPMMHCVTVTKPALLVIGVLEVFTSGLLLFGSIREISRSLRLKAA